MKRRIAILLAVCFLTGILNAAYALGSGTKAIGDIVFTNGQRIDSIKFEMPLVQDKEIKVTIDGIKHKFKADSIQYIMVWSEKYPEEKHLFKSFRIENVDLETGEIIGIGDDPIWLCCDQSEENASYWLQIGRPSFKKGHLVFNYNNLYSYVSKAYILKNGRANPSHVPNKGKDVKTWAKVYFSDDPDVIRKLEAGEYDASDWGHKYTDLSRLISDYRPMK